MTVHMLLLLHPGIDAGIRRRAFRVRSFGISCGCRAMSESAERAIAELSHIMLTHAHPSAVFVHAYFVQHVHWRGFLHLRVKAVVTARNACPYICMARLDFAEAHRAGRIDRST
jgi:hypothetical protein